MSSNPTTARRDQDHAVAPRSAHAVMVRNHEVGESFGSLPPLSQGPGPSTAERKTRSSGDPLSSPMASRSRTQRDYRRHVRRHFREYDDWLKQDNIELLRHDWCSRNIPCTTVTVELIEIVIIILPPTPSSFKSPLRHINTSCPSPSPHPEGPTSHAHHLLQILSFGEGQILCLCIEPSDHRNDSGDHKQSSKH